MAPLTLIVLLLLGAGLAYAANTLPQFAFLGPAGRYGLMGDIGAAVVGSIVAGIIISLILGANYGGLIVSLVVSVAGALGGIYAIRRATALTR